MTRFLKMHGLGNDFVVFDARNQHLALDDAAARAISDRRRGIGCDQVIVIRPSLDGADAFMQVRNSDGGEVGDGNVTVDWGKAKLAWNEVPMAKPADTDRFLLEVGGDKIEASALSVGNPHVVLFVANADKAPVAELGPRIETHPMFPARTNVEFVSVEGEDRLRMRVWERGAGITQACG